jgi:hypothetical protein
MAAPPMDFPLQKAGNLPKRNISSYSKVPDDLNWGKIDEWKLAT